MKKSLKDYETYFTHMSIHRAAIASSSMGPGTSFDKVQLLFKKFKTHMPGNVFF